MSITIDININTIEYMLISMCIAEYIRPTTPAHNRTTHNITIKDTFNICLHSRSMVNNVLIILIYQNLRTFLR